MYVTTYSIIKSVVNLYSITKQFLLQHANLINGHGYGYYYVNNLLFHRIKSPRKARRLVHIGIIITILRYYAQRVL